MFKVSLTIEGLDAASHEDAAKMFRDAVVLDGLNLVLVVSNDKGAEKVIHACFENHFAEAG